MNICIIPARGGSTRIPRKNIKLFHGKPIIAYSIELALGSGLFDGVYVSTEDAEIGEIAENYGAFLSKRSVKMAQDNVGTQEVMREVLLKLQGVDWIACCLYATAPLLRRSDLWRGVKALDKHDYAFSCGSNPLRDAGGFYMGWARAFKCDAPLFDERTAMIPIPDERCCDINTISDWNRAEQMYTALHQRAA